MKKISSLRLLCMAFASCSLFTLYVQAGDAQLRASILAKPQVLQCGYRLGESVFDYYYGQVVQQDLAADNIWSTLKTPAKIAGHQRRLRADAIVSLGGFPERTPLNAQVTGTYQGKGYRLEKVLFESRPHHYVTAHLFLPDDPKFTAPYPAILSPCGHSLSGKLAPWYQRPGVIGATHGFATLVYDPIDQGERLQRRSITNLNWSSTGEHNRCGLRAALVGWNTAQFRIWDGMRAIDYLQSRKEVDSEKIGVMGISGGGTLSSYIMALDDRIRAACPAGFLSTMRAVCDRCGPQDAEQQFFGQLAFGLNHLGYVLLRAPSPVMLNATHADFFPFGGTLETYQRAKSLYAQLGAEKNIALFDVPGPHHWFDSEQQASVAWMTRWLKGRSDINPTLAEQKQAFKMLDANFSYAKVDCALTDLKNTQRPYNEAGRVTPEGFVMKLPGARNVYDIIQDEYKRLKGERTPLTPARVRTRLGLSAEEPAILGVRAPVTNQCEDGVCVIASTVITEENLRLPTIAFLPTHPQGTPVLLLTDEPRITVSNRVEQLLSAGRTVLIAELRAFGETGKVRVSQSYGFYGCKDGDEEVALVCAWLGKSLVGERTADIFRVQRILAQLTNNKPCEIIAEGRAVIPAAHAFYLAKDRFTNIICVRPPYSWSALLANPDLDGRFANAIQGALIDYDWPDLIHNNSRK